MVRPHPKEESFIKSDADEDMFTGAVENPPFAMGMVNVAVGLCWCQ